MLSYGHTDIFSLCRCGSNPVNSTIDAISESEGVIILAVDSAPHMFDGCNCRFGCTGGDHMDRTTEEFPSLEVLNQLNSKSPVTYIHRPKL